MIAPYSKTNLAIIDVGHGNSAVLRDDGQTVIIDTGSQNSLLEYLTQHEIKIIDTILLSHADADHIGGLLILLSSKHFTIHKIRVNSDALKKSAIWDDLLYELEMLQRSSAIDFRPSLTTRDNGEFDTKAVKVEILAPNTYLAGKGVGGQDRNKKTIQTNSLSSVIRLVAEDKPVAVFPGDIDDIGLDNLIEMEGNSLAAPILVFPHHGGRAGHSIDMEQFTNRLCDIFQPEKVIFSIDRNRAYLRPDVITTLRRRKSAIKIACTQLSTHCATELPKTSPTHLASAFSAGKSRFQCCAGTIVIPIERSINIQPNESAHLDYIRQVAPTALCQKMREDTVLS